MFNALLRAVGLRGSTSREDPEAFRTEAISLSVTDAYHTQFVTECRNALDAIQQRKATLPSRRVRSAIDGLSEGVRSVISCCQEHKESVSEIRGLPAQLRTIGELLDAYSALSSVHDPADLTRSAELCATMRGLKDTFTKMEQDMRMGSRINFHALSTVVDRMVERGRELGAFPSQ